MARQRPLVLVVIGAASAVFAVLYLVWLLLASWTNLRRILAVAFGESSALPDLARDNLAGTDAVRWMFLQATVRAVLMLVLLASGVGLVLHWRWARWAAFFGGALMIVLALTNTVAGVWFLTLPAGAVKVTPLIMDAVAVLFANLLCGTMFLPEVAGAYGGYLESAPLPGPDEAVDRPARA